MFVDSLTEHIGPLDLCSLLSVEYFINFEDAVQSLSTHVFFMCLFFDAHVTMHHQPNIRVRVQKVTE